MATLVFKIVKESEWVAARRAGHYDGSADDRRDGFIHFSTRDQLHGTAEKHFRNLKNLVLVAFNAGTLGPNLKFEASRGGAHFPHYYGVLNPELALWAKAMIPGVDGIPHCPSEET